MIAGTDRFNIVVCKRSNVQRSRSPHYKDEYFRLGYFYSIVASLLLICVFALEKYKLMAIEDHRLYNKSYDNVGVDSYLQPTGA